MNFIRGMGIKAWIPGSPGSSPKMSVADQCRSGVFCLNHKGLEIYSTKMFLFFINDHTFVYILISQF